MDEYDHMQKLARKKGIMVQIELEMRYDQTVKRIKKLCDSGAIGNIISVQINNTTVCVPPSLMPWVTNPKETYGKEVHLRKGDNRFRGGALTDHPHTFDLVRYFTNSEFEYVFADVSPNFRKGRVIEEGVFVVGKMKNGVSINIDPSYSRHENKVLPIHPSGPGWEGYPKRVEVDVVINGDKGTIFADCFHSGVFYMGTPQNAYAYQYVDNNSHYYPSLDAFADCVYNRIEPMVNLDFHRKTMEAVNACYESINTARPVFL